MNLYGNFTHKEVIERKYLLRQIYIDRYKSLLNKIIYPCIELGSGHNLIKTVIPGVVTSDVNPDCGTDMVIDISKKLPFANGSVGSFVIINTVHHLYGDVIYNLLSEIIRCLKPKGKIFIYEPAMTPFSRLFWRFHFEGYTMARMPWAYFLHTKYYEHRNLNLIKLKYLSPVMHFLSGGYSRLTFVPDTSYAFLKRIDKLFEKMHFLNRIFAVFMYMELERE